MSILHYFSPFGERFWARFLRFHSNFINLSNGIINSGGKSARKMDHKLCFGGEKIKLFTEIVYA
jgi:hypothetical protein